MSETPMEFTPELDVPEAAPPRATTPEPMTGREITDDQIIDWKGMSWGHYNAPVARMLDEITNLRIKLRAVSPSRASGAPDSTDRGAAMRDDELDDIRQYARWEKDAEPHVLRAIVRQCVREIDRLRALSTGEPSPDIAALRCPTGGVCGLSEDVCHCTEMSALLDELRRLAYVHGFNEGYTPDEDPAAKKAVDAARAAVDAHLVSLLARLTAAERALRDIAEWAELETGRAGRIPAHRVAEKARAALPLSGNTAQ